MNSRINIALIVASSLLILVPPAISAMAWTTINLYVAIVMLGLFAAIAYFYPQWKWLIILIAAVQATFPPYPYWIWHSKELGWHFSIMQFEFSHQELKNFGLLFGVMCLFLWALFQAIQKYKRP
jgi:hypothetical protein